MTIRKKETNKEYFNNLVLKANHIKNTVKRQIDFIESSYYEEFIINTNIYYLTM
jgi:hypothetical protein